MNTNRKGYTIDADAIARGLLDLIGDLPECYAVALKFGMLPAPLMECLETSLRQKGEEIIGDRFGDIDAIDADRFPTIRSSAIKARRAWIDRFVRDCSNEVAHAMYRHTEMVV